MKNIFSKTLNTAEGLFNKGMDSVFMFFHNRRKFNDVREIHGFYRLETPSGRLLEYRHHCPVSGDARVVRAVKGAIAVHCPQRKRDVFDPGAAMPAVIRYPAQRSGMAQLPDGSRVIDTTVGEFGGDFGYSPSDPGAVR